VVSNDLPHLRLHGWPDQLDIVVPEDHVDLVSGVNEPGETGKYCPMARPHALKAMHTGFGGRRTGPGFCLEWYLKEVEEIAKNDEAKESRRTLCLVKEMIDKPAKRVIVEEVFVAMKRARASVITSRHMEVAEYNDVMRIRDRYHDRTCHSVRSFIGPPSHPVRMSAQILV
jgi:hypothetical protein